MEASDPEKEKLLKYENTMPNIDITPCEDWKASISDLSHENGQNSSKFKLPIGITDLWRIRRKEKIKKRSTMKSEQFSKDDGSEDSDSYSFDHDSLVTPSINTSQIDPSMDSDADAGDFSWGSDNSHNSHSSSFDSASGEMSWASNPAIDGPQDSCGSSEDLLNEGPSGENCSRRASICTVIETKHKRSKSVFNKDTSIPKSNSKSKLNESSNDSNSDSNDEYSKTKALLTSKQSETTFDIDVIEKPLEIKRSDVNEDNNEDFNEIMKNMTLASFSNKKRIPSNKSDESIEDFEEQTKRLSNIKLMRNLSTFIGDNVQSEMPNTESTSNLSKYSILKPEHIIEVEENEINEDVLPNTTNDKDTSISKSDSNLKLIESSNDSGISSKDGYSKPKAFFKLKQRETTFDIDAIEKPIKIKRSEAIEDDYNDEYSKPKHFSKLRKRETTFDIDTIEKPFTARRSNAIEDRSKCDYRDENDKLELNKKEREKNGITSNIKDKHTIENNYIYNKGHDNNDNGDVNKSLELKTLEKAVGLGIEKSCWCCVIL